MTTIRRCIVVGAALCVFGFTWQMSAQAQAAAVQRIRILTAGGLLGQYDGMPEYPAGRFDTEVGPGMRPYGGLRGLTKWMQNDESRVVNGRPQGRPDLFLMTANNLPRQVSLEGPAALRPFFDEVRALQPAAIAVGVEDFLRGLDGRIESALPPKKTNLLRSHGPDKRTGGVLVTRMRLSGLPFLLTNAAVRLHGVALNRISDQGLTLLIDDSQSLGWVNKLQFSFPCSRRPALLNMSAAIARTSTVETSSDTRPLTATVRLDDKRCQGTISLGARLAPDAAYQLTLTPGGTASATFTVRTDERLAPHTAVVPERKELPIVVALVDPHVRAILSDAKWRWRTGADSQCAATECEIVILPPVDALEAALGFAEGTATGRPVALLSELEDADMSVVLQSNPRVRLVVLPPDSLALGRAATRTLPMGRGNTARPVAADGLYSGDLGYGAILNTNTPAVTQVWVRPEWFAESIHEMAMDVDRESWHIRNASSASHSIKGLALCAMQGTRGTEVDYFLEDWQINDGVTVYRLDRDVSVAKAPYRYAPISAGSPFDRDGRFQQGPLWTDLSSFAAVALDAMRRGLNTDVAVLPAEAIDDNWLTYLRDDPHAPSQWLSKVMLQRLLFRAGTIVKVRVAGSDLISKMGAIVKRDSVGGYCVTGFNFPQCGKLDFGDTGLVNDRRVDKNRYYTIAMPESVALENKLGRVGTEEDDIVYLMDRVFAQDQRPAQPTCSTAVRAGALPAEGSAAQEVAPPRDLEPLATRLERARSKENSPYLFIRPLEFVFTQTQITEPADGTGLFNKLSLSLQSTGARPSRRTSVNVAVDFGAVDTRDWAVRVLGALSYGRALVNAQSSTDPNAWLVGARVDRKLSARGRFFGGGFWESRFTDTITNVTPVRNSVPGPTVGLVSRLRDYRYLAVGFELENPRFKRFDTRRFRQWLSFDPLRVSAMIGTSQNEHVDITINGERQGLANLQKFGVQGLLDRYYQTHPTIVEYAFVDESLLRASIQMDITPRVTLPLAGRKIEVALATTYRRFVGPNMLSLSERQAFATRLTIGIPIYGLATLNLNTVRTASQVNGINGWFRVWQPSVSVSVPVMASRHAGWMF